MRLKDYLLKNHMTPIDFALQSGIEVTAIYRACRGIKIGMRNAKKIFEETGGTVKVEGLITGTPQKYRPLRK